MKYGSLILDKNDFVMIKRQLNLNRFIEDYAHKDALDKLRENICDAMVCEPGNMPDDVIKIYSHFTLTCETGWIQTFQLVQPHEQNKAKQKISVQSTLGASIIGLSEGDRILYGLPADIIHFRISDVEQSVKRIAKNDAVNLEGSKSNEEVKSDTSHQGVYPFCTDIQSKKIVIR